MNYIRMRYGVVIVVAMPLVMNGMMSRKLALVNKKIVSHNNVIRRSFFHQESKFYTLIDNPGFSITEADKIIRQEVVAALKNNKVLCRMSIIAIQKNIVANAVKYKSIDTVLQDRFDRIEKYDEDFNTYNSDKKYACLLKQLHLHVAGEVCRCGVGHQQSKAFSVAFAHDLDNILDELEIFEALLERE